MKKTAIALALVATIGLAACEKDAGKADLDEPKVSGDILPSEFEQRAPDKLVIYSNVNSFPNIVRLCIDGLAFRTVSDHYAGLATPAVERVAEWDDWCQS